MTNNDIFRRIRYAFDLKEATIVNIFALAEVDVTPAQVTAWLKKDEDEALVPMKNRELAAFLNGFISFKRGKREGPVPAPETQLNNNMVFQKLRIALNMKAEDVLAVFEQVGLPLSPHELSAFFRKPSHKNYRECKDQMLRNFLMGVQQQQRPSQES
ncbi:MULTISPECIES: DUF1456 family protein [Halomonadaceae]|uniref:DUF1456 family protein n=3 Tax=Halomonadaceae TaxID=28256 RepID=A0A8H9I718_9GAMM|nr:MULTISPECIES: DUF1456 family protein [Halomonas]ATH78567.1 DUF1456 domain-containing protein [Halomonas hydrothermalis]NGO89996.1 DUF1456 family protein [Halomonas sp.]PJX14327.1 DUF1456 domain-containing protein [Halomonas sp. 141]GGW25628.1 hypothetical protein GCM10007157_17190 [Halomonas hamiltonii]GGW63870.1 hypothetical protein GCM10007158_25770 [Halomonas johnsoniae]